MSFSQVRTYLRARVNDIDSSLVEWLEPFDRENIPESVIDTRYHLSLSNVSTESPSDASVADTMTAEITLFKRGFKEAVTEHDALIDLANCIRLRCADPLLVASTDNIKGCFPSGVTMEPLEVSNDNIIRCTITFDVILYFSITDLVIT